MMGSSFVLSDRNVRGLCNIATHIESVDELDGVVGL